ncbi:hypothetical protein GN316_18475 [Xylophilus sp. Kf1]|nr:hypothetical protein [Xylophilus sp. Kf1]
MKSLSRKIGLIGWIGLGAIVVGLLAACGGGGGDVFGSDASTSGPAKVTSIEIKNDKPTIAAGESTDLRAIVHYSDNSTAEIKSFGNNSRTPFTSISWSASPSSIAEFTSASIGTLRTSLPGVVMVTATEFFSKVTGLLNITVSAPLQNSIVIGGLTHQQTISTRTTTQLTATTVKTDGSREPATPVVWTSSNTAVATVDAAGNFKGVAAGSVSITATSGAFTNIINLTLLAPLAKPLVSVSCDPLKPTAIDAEQWNTQYAIDGVNATEWVAVDGVSCQSRFAIELLTPQKDGSRYDVKFFSLRSPVNPAVFSPGSVGGNLAAKQTVSVGETKDPLGAFFAQFTEIYTFLTK